MRLCCYDIFQRIANHPERLQTLDFSFVQCLQSLTASIDVDLDVPLAK